MLWLGPEDKMGGLSLLRQQPPFHSAVGTSSFVPHPHPGLRNFTVKPLPACCETLYLNPGLPWAGVEGAGIGIPKWQAGLGTPLCGWRV